MTDTERTLISLRRTSPDNTGFISEIFIHAIRREYHGSDPETPVARAIASAFYEGKVTGAEINRLYQYTNGNVREAFEILTTPEKLAKFQAESHR